ncbi:hypothetical protein KUCAC02_032580 [Chaenocephalus aceratus]|nr:hypothetical protein KUCAC02_032580 [Chaenocephalus aceratus]
MTAPPVSQSVNTPSRGSEQQPVLYMEVRKETLTLAQLRLCCIPSATARCNHALPHYVGVDACAAWILVRLQGTPSPLLSPRSKLFILIATNPSSERAIPLFFCRREKRDVGKTPRQHCLHKGCSLAGNT